MNKTLRNSILIVLIFTFFVINLAQAGDSASIPVSCSIPAVPGLNAPLVEEKTPKDIATTVENENLQDQTGEETVMPIEEDTQEETLLANGKTVFFALRTVYRR